MSPFFKVGVAVLGLLLLCSAAAPISHAQSRSQPYVLQMNTSGSYLGVTMDDVTSENMAKYKLGSEKGVIVRSVQNGSPAEDAKLQKDDVILEFGGNPVWSSNQFSRLVSETPQGRKVDMVVSRDGKRITVTAKIGSRGATDRSYDRNVLPRDFMDRLFPFQSPGGREDRPSEPAQKPRLGISLQPVTDQLGESWKVPGKKGALVASVVEGSPASGKLEAGDVVIRADEKEIKEPDDLIQAVNEKSEGALVLKVIRDKKEITVTVTLPALPAEEGGGLKL
jgi:serine protease Do